MRLVARILCGTAGGHHTQRSRAGHDEGEPRHQCDHRQRPRSRVRPVGELRLDVGERGVISDVLGRLGGHFARSSLSVAKQLEWDNTGTHAQ